MNKNQIVRVMMVIALIFAVNFGAIAQVKIPVATKATSVKEIEPSAAKLSMLKDFKVLEQPVDEKNSSEKVRNRLPTIRVGQVTKPDVKPLPDGERVYKVSGKLPRGVELLGKGYNVHIGEYADAASLTRYILDYQALVEDGHIGKAIISKDYERCESAESISKWSQEYATNVGVKGSYGFFKASADFGWKGKSQTEYGRTYASVSYKATLYKVYINPAIIPHLSYYLRDDYKEALKKAAETGAGQKGRLPAVRPGSGNVFVYPGYKTLIQDFGTHLLCSAIMGGTLDYYVSTDYSYSATEDEFTANAKAGFNNTFASIGAEVSTSKKTTTSQFDKASKSEKRTSPTIAEMGATNATWFQNLKNYAVMIDFQDAKTTGTNGLRPLYEISKDAKIWNENGTVTYTYNGAATFKAQYENYAKGTLYAASEKLKQISTGQITKGTGATFTQVQGDTEMATGNGKTTGWELELTLVPKPSNKTIELTYEYIVYEGGKNSGSTNSILRLNGTKIINVGVAFTNTNKQEVKLKGNLVGQHHEWYLERTNKTDGLVRQLKIRVDDQGRNDHDKIGFDAILNFNYIAP